MSQSQTKDQPKSTRRRDIEHQQPHDINNTIKAKQLTLSSSLERTQKTALQNNDQHKKTQTRRPTINKNQQQQNHRLRTDSSQGQGVAKSSP